jgi:hypothetical protein
MSLLCAHKILDDTFGYTSFRVSCSSGGAGNCIVLDFALSKPFALRNSGDSNTYDIVIESEDESAFHISDFCILLSFSIHTSGR